MRDLYKKNILLLLLLFTVGWANAQATNNPRSGVGALNGVFSVSDNTQVRFSRGNLQYIGSAGNGDENNTGAYWKFAEHQWESLGDNGQGSDSKTVDRDLFGWGASGYNHGANCYQPWSTSISYSDYYVYSSDTYNLYDQSGQADWGYNAISNGGNQENSGWRTLTRDEWDYVINTRTMVNGGPRYTVGRRVEGVLGVIVYPDNYTGSAVSSDLTSEGWAEYEAAGCAFLPAAGYRGGTSVNHVGSRGNYWSASYSNSNYAGGVYFSGNGLYTSSYGNRYDGHSVRLVRPAQNYSFTINATSNPAEGGVVSGAGAYVEGAECTLTATASAGYTFVNWTENGEVVSTDPTYLFTVTGDRELVANFELNEPFTIDYISDGLIMYLDGIRNMRSGHSSNTNVWEDLVGNYDVAVTNYNSYTWEDNHFMGLGNEGYLNTGKTWQYFNSLNNDITIEIVTYIDCDRTSPGYRGIVGWHSDADGMNVQNDQGWSRMQTLGSLPVSVVDDQIATVSYTLNSGSFLDGIWRTNDNNVSNGVNSNHLVVFGNSFSSQRGWNDSIYCIRMYNRTLTPDEIAYNHSVDVERFGAGSLNTFNITASPTPAEGGTVSGAGAYAVDAECTLTATAAAGYNFINWTENGEVVSTEATYSFTVSGDRALVANFEQSASHLTSLSDDFNDGVINEQLWTATGTHVIEEDGLLKLQQNVTDNYTALETQPMGVPTDNKIIIDRRFLLHEEPHYWNGGDSYFCGNVFIMIDGSDDNYIGIIYYDYDWDDYGATVNRYGTYIRTQIDGVTSEEIRICDAVFDTWMTEQIVVDLTANTLYYYRDDAFIATVDIPTVHPNFYTVRFKPDGWWTGHYHYMDYININTNLDATYTITASANPVEGGTVSEGGTFQLGQTCSLTATANQGFTFINWTENGEVVSTENPYTFTVAGDRALVANFILSSLSDDFNDGVIDPKLWTYGGSSVYEADGLMKIEQNVTDDDVRLTTLPMSLIDSGLIVMERSFMVHRANNYFSGGFAINFNGVGDEASFIRVSYWYENYIGKYGTYVDASIDGQVTETFLCDAVFDTWINEKVIVDTETGTLLYFLGNELVATATIAGLSSLDVSYYTIRFWPYSWWTGHYHYMDYININTNLDATYTITASANPVEGGTVSEGGTFQLGQTCSLTATAAEGYTFVNWTENGEVVSTEATYSFHVVSDRDLVANFMLPLNITASVLPEEGGTVTGAGEYDYGTECTLVAIPDEDYFFVRWTKGETVVSTQASYSFVVTEDADYVAHFTLKMVGTVMAEYDPDPDDNQSPYVRVSWSMDSNLQEDFESGDFNMHPWEFTDSYPWVITDYNPYEGTFCMRSNNGGAHYTSSTVQTTMFIPSEGQMSFYSRISSESWYDYGRFYIDGQEMGNWSGNGGWEQHIYDITVGQHTFTWAYTKDGSVNSGEDCFYVDNINFFGADRSGNRSVHHYEVYRSEHPENGSWELLADNVADTSYVDTGWSALAEGWYKYGVVAYYEGYDTVYPTYMARSNRILRAYPHSITATANPEEGGTITGAGDYVLYTECTLTATASENYTFVNWTENGQEVSTETTYSFTVTTERDLVANFLLPLNITALANPEEGGTITGAGEYDYNSECTLTAIPDEDYYFVNWTENGTVVSRNAIYSFTVTTERDLVAHFEFKPVGLVTAVYDPDPEDNQSPYVRVNWNMGFNLREDFESGDFSQHEWETNWVISNNSYEGEYCMSSSNHGNYSSSYAQVTVNIPNDRQMSFWSRISSESSYDYGRFYIDDQQLGAWSGNGGWEQHTYDVSAGEHTFKWEYTKDVSLSHNDDCFYVDYIDFVSGARGDRAVDHYQVFRSEHPENGSWELLADNVMDTTYVDTEWSALSEGWYKYGVVANYVGIDTIYTTPMIRSNRILRAYPHTITATANPEVGGTVEGTGVYIYDSECTLTANPNENYTFMYWTEDGEVVSTETTYTFTVTADRDLVANFTLPFTISVSVVPEEGGIVTGAGVYNIGTECTLTATANEGYEFMYWTENGTMVSSNATYSFTVTEDRTLVAYFAENTQAISLSSGWTWISTYIEQGGIDGLTLLEEGLGSNGVMIKSQADGFLSYANGMWMGTLDAIANEKMYLVSASEASESIITGYVAHLNDHPITLNPNWTWVGYPFPFAMDVSDALANLNPAEGDLMKSQSGFATYSAANGWYGSLNTLTPGLGFMYQSHNSQAVTLTFSVGLSRSLRANVTAENNHWVPDIHAYPNNMSIMAVVELDGVELQDERYELAVFSGAECRGSVRLVYVEPIRRYVAFLSVTGEDDAELSLALYDTMTDEAYFNTKDVLNFEADAVLGSLRSPFVARFGSAAGLDGFDAEAVILYPNPVTAGHLFQIELPAECKGAQVSIIDVWGSVISTTDLYAKPATLSAPDVPGVYTVRVMMDKQGTYSRKLIVK